MGNAAKLKQSTWKHEIEYVMQMGEMHHGSGGGEV